MLGMVPPAPFLACPSCNCHVRSHEIECPHCGARVRREGGGVPRTAAALLMGLTATFVPAAGAATGCSSSVETSGNGSGGAGGIDGSGGLGGMGAHAGSVASASGVAVSVDTGVGASSPGVGGSGSIAAAYGVGGTLDTGVGAGSPGVGGAGGEGGQSTTTAQGVGGAAPAYGVALTDDDKDGYLTGEDCDDGNPDIHPGARETPDDGVDSNCNGDDDD